MKTVHVRIAVAVQENGNWNSNGYGFSNGKRLPDSESSEMASAGVEDCRFPTLVSFVEADAPVPEPIVVQGKVTE